MLHDVGNNRDCDVDVYHRNNTSPVYNITWPCTAIKSASARKCSDMPAML